MVDSGLKALLRSVTLFLCGAEFLRLVLLRRNHLNHLPSFHLWHLFNRTVLFQVISDPGQKLRAQFLVRHLPTAESQGDFRFITVLKKLNELPELDLVIAFVRSRTEFDFLYMNLLLLAFRSLVFFVLFEQVLTKIHNSAYRRLRHRRNLDEVQSLILGQIDRCCEPHDPCLLTIRANNPHFGGLDFIVAPYALCNCDTQILR